MIKSDQHKVFGGYKHITHTVTNNYQADANAFLFSLTNRQKLTQYQNNTYATYTNNSYLSTFGGNDIYISDQCNTNKSSYSNLGHTYKPPNGHAYGTNEAKNYLAGLYNFFVIEIEVY